MLTWWTASASSTRAKLPLWQLHQDLVAPAIIVLSICKGTPLMVGATSTERKEHTMSTSGRYAAEPTMAELRAELTAEAVPVAKLLDTLTPDHVEPVMLAALAAAYADYANKHASAIHLVLSDALMRVWLARNKART